MSSERLTLGDIEKIIDELNLHRQERKPALEFDWGAGVYGRNFLGGIRVFEHPLLERQPKMKLSQHVAAGMDPRWVAEYNAWLLEFFGYEPERMYFMPASGIVLAPPSRMAMITNFTV